MRVNKIPPVDLARQYQTIQSAADAAVLDILRSGLYIGGPTIQAFEQQFADYIGVSDCVACNSGTDALYLALRALGIGEGDEVITTPFTFIATAEAVDLVGATPVFVDIDLETFNIDVEQIAGAITEKTKAIIPVHLYGQSAHMSKLVALAESHNLFIVEDCAQATGAKWQDKTVGSIGHIGCFSFFPTKNLGGCGDGGAVTTNDPAIAASVRVLKEHGSKVRYYHDQVGINSRLDAIQAALLSIKLPHLDQWNQQRQEIAERYHQLLQSISEIILPAKAPDDQHVWNQFTICLPDEVVGEKLLRDTIREKLQTLGIISMIYYPIPLHLQPVYQHLSYQKGQLPRAEKAARTVLSLPMFPDLTATEQEKIAYALKECLSH